MDVYLQTNSCCHVHLQNRLQIRLMSCCCGCEHRDGRVYSDDVNARVKSPLCKLVEASCIQHACELLPYGSQLDVYEFL